MPPTPIEKVLTEAMRQNRHHEDDLQTAAALVARLYSRNEKRPWLGDRGEPLRERSYQQATGFDRRANCDEIPPRVRSSTGSPATYLTHNGRFQPKHAKA